MTIFELAEKFSRQLKLDKAQYLIGETVDQKGWPHFLSQFKQVDLSVLDNDDKKKAFWINVYNGFTNMLTIQRKLKKSRLNVTGLTKTRKLL